MILGSYGIQISSGEVTICGATLGRMENKIHWVDAPYCHALPVIRCPEEATLEIHPHPEASTLRDLGKLSPYFRRLWNDTTASKSTFQIVCNPPKALPHNHGLIIPSSTLQKMGPSEHYCKTWSLRLNGIRR